MTWRTPFRTPLRIPWQACWRRRWRAPCSQKVFAKGVRQIMIKQLRFNHPNRRDILHRIYGIYRI